MICVSIKRACVLMLGLGLAAGCDRGTPEPAPTSQPSTAPATMPATVPARVMLTIDGREFVFASPRVLLENEGRLLTILSDEAADAAGTFHLELPVEDDEPGTEGWSSEIQVQQEERAESLVGIVLTRPEQTLQPVSLKLAVKPMGEKLAQVQVEGTFLVYPDDSTVASSRVTATGKFVAAMVRE